MPRRFDQDAKDRVVRLVEDRILAENVSMQAGCQAVAPKLGFHGAQLVNGIKPARRAETSQNPCLTIWSPKVRGYAVKTRAARHQ